VGAATKLDGKEGGLGGRAATARSVTTVAAEERPDLPTVPGVALGRFRELRKHDVHGDWNYTITRGGRSR
jgi:hypothetical protein